MNDKNLHSVWTKVKIEVIAAGLFNLNVFSMYASKVIENTLHAR